MGRLRRRGGMGEGGGKEWMEKGINGGREGEGKVKEG